MPKYEDILSKKGPVGIEIDGTFECQTCLEWVIVAHYDNINKLLVWKCSEQHTSFIKDFSL